MKPARISAGGTPLTLDLNVTTGMIDRLRGWMGRKSITEHDALLIQPCNSIHTWFMSAPIDVVFLDRHDRVVGVRDNVGPRRVCMHWRAASALELQAGRGAALGLAPGVQLDIDDGDIR
ncbi:DUF192 domain-containing protein [Paraburkholderia sartisoli]|uniref:DUF192 domain-containing protein n=1 Tax=Paraburkholderia sartisoli TaxID=83784 RepID=A0A1H3XYI0_9BURK|nr:DUF192 domain-containing protein [Paraburkholderia sartisoli]SEA03674.1 hypothetical protein SAMN05192564_10147 [Paraburkholderia sartisoli]